MLANVGDVGPTYKDFTPFDVDKLRSHVSIFYVLQGLSPSPRVEYNCNCQCDEPVYGNDYVQQATTGKGNCFCPHKHFKAFFIFLSRSVLLTKFRS